MFLLLRSKDRRRGAFPQLVQSVGLICVIKTGLPAWEVLHKLQAVRLLTVCIPTTRLRRGLIVQLLVKLFLPVLQDLSRARLWTPMAKYYLLRLNSNNLRLLHHEPPLH